MVIMALVDNMARRLPGMADRMEGPSPFDSLSLPCCDSVINNRLLRGIYYLPIN